MAGPGLHATNYLRREPPTNSLASYRHTTLSSTLYFPAHLSVPGGATPLSPRNGYSASLETDAGFRFRRSFCLDVRLRCVRSHPFFAGRQLRGMDLKYAALQGCRGYRGRGGGARDRDWRLDGAGRYSCSYSSLIIYHRLSTKLVEPLLRLKVYSNYRDCR